MGEYIKYRNREVKIGTCENLYYVSYQKYIEALSAGLLAKLDGNSYPKTYTDLSQEFRFRFPFPDEDKLKFGDIIEPYNRGIPITIDDRLVYGQLAVQGKVIQIEIVQQKPIKRQSDGKFCLALVFNIPGTGNRYSISEDKDLRPIVAEMIRNNIINEPDPQKKAYFRAVAVRIFKGYGLDVVKEYKQASKYANQHHNRNMSTKNNTHKLK